MTELRLPCASNLETDLSTQSTTVSILGSGIWDGPKLLRINQAPSAYFDTSVVWVVFQVQGFGIRVL